MRKGVCLDILAQIQSGSERTHCVLVTKGFWFNSNLELLHYYTPLYSYICFNVVFTIYLFFFFFVGFSFYLNFKCVFHINQQ